MAIRYSANVEVRMRYDEATDTYRVSVVDPDRYWIGTFRARGRKPSRERYDRLARAAIARASLERGHRFDADRRGGRVRIERVFKAPCPL